MPAPARYDLHARGLTADEALGVEARLRAGDLAIYPTDSLYAIGCCALDGAAVSRLRQAKGREALKPLPVIVADIAQARSLASEWSEGAQRLADAFWPGPLTLVAPAAVSTLPAELLAGAVSVAMRVPASDVARALARLAGPLVATSANLAGKAPCVTVDLALAVFPLATLAFDVGLLDGAPSTIVDLSNQAAGPRILREGRISADEVQQVLRTAASSR